MYYNPPAPPPVVKAKPKPRNYFAARIPRNLPDKISNHPILASPDIGAGQRVQIGDFYYEVQVDGKGLGGFSLKKIGKAIGKAAKQTVSVVKKVAPIALAFAPIPIVGGLVNKALNLQKTVKSLAPVKAAGSVQKLFAQPTPTPPPAPAVPLPQYAPPPPAQDITAILAQRDADAAAKRVASQAVRAQQKADAATAAAAKKIEDDKIKAAKKADRARAKAEAAVAAAAADAGNAAKQEAARVAALQAEQAVSQAQAAAAVPAPSGGGGGSSTGGGGSGGGSGASFTESAPDASVSADATATAEAPASEGMSKMLPIILAGGLALVLLGGKK